MVQNYSGDSRTRTPEKALLYQNEDSMLFLEKEFDKIFRMDLNRGEVVEEFTTPGINAICSDFKNAQMTPASEFLGINQRGVFKFDPRISSENKIVDK